MRAYKKLAVFFVMSCLILAGCAEKEAEERADKLVLKPASFAALPGWENDDHNAALSAFARSCARIMRQDSARTFGPDGIGGTNADWHGPCRALRALNSDETSPAQARAFFERWFVPYQATNNGEQEYGLFTGYYEASLNGSRTPHGPYQYPLRARPDDLVMVDLGAFRDSLRGQRIAGRVSGGALRPYEDHKTIATGGLPADSDRPLLWVDSRIDRFFLQIQGSGVVEMDDGTQVRIGYAGQNGHPYYAIGRELVARGHMSVEQVSMQSIRSWLEENPDQADEILFTNKSYVFFQELDTEGPLGGENVVLTPERSLAIDRSLMPYGMPVWVDIDGAEKDDGRLRRLMIAQDTGGAIRGPVRGDYFWGHGPQAEHKAGLMRSQGRYWLLLPAALTAMAD